MVRDVEGVALGIRVGKHASLGTALVECWGRGAVRTPRGVIRRTGAGPLDPGAASGPAPMLGSCGRELWSPLDCSTQSEFALLQTERENNCIEIQTVRVYFHLIRKITKH